MVIRLVRALTVVAVVGGVAWGGMDVEASAGAVGELEGFLAVEGVDWREAAGEAFAGVALTRGDAGRAKELLWEAHVAEVRRERGNLLEEKVVRAGGYEMRLLVREFGEKPAAGHSLYISLHGGGGTTAAKNDQQWRNQIRLYEPNEGLVVAPRAPTDVWNMWFLEHMDRLYDALIYDLVALGEVDANRVYLMGYSAGGDGVYQVAPRLADRLAAAAMMAGHPNDSSPLGLRNIGFAIYAGGQDATYHRNFKAAEWRGKLELLEFLAPGAYRHKVVIYDDKGHWMDGEDREALEWLAGFRRDPLPEEIVWCQNRVVHGRFYWLAVDASRMERYDTVRAVRRGQEVRVESSRSVAVRVRLDDAMMDLDRPVRVTGRGLRGFEGRVERTIGVLAATLGERGDREGMYPAEVVLEPAGEGLEAGGLGGR